MVMQFVKNSQIFSNHTQPSCITGRTYKVFLDIHKKIGWPWLDYILNFRTELELNNNLDVLGQVELNILPDYTSAIYLNTKL